MAPWHKLQAAKPEMHKKHCCPILCQDSAARFIVSRFGCSISLRQVPCASPDFWLYAATVTSLAPFVPAPSHSHCSRIPATSVTVSLPLPPRSPPRPSPWPQGNCQTRKVASRGCQISKLPRGCQNPNLVPTTLSKPKCGTQRLQPHNANGVPQKHTESH